MSEESKVQPKESKIKILSWKRLLFLISILLLIITIIYVEFLIPNIKYNKALELYESGRYGEAIELFSILQDYKDSEDMILNILYDDAIYSYDKHNYDIAIRRFKELGDYKDSNHMIQKSIYYKAIAYSNKKDWALAIETMSKIPHFDDSKELLLEYKYNLGIQKSMEKDWDSAVEIMNSLLDYNDSNLLVQDYSYSMALEKAYDYDWNSAIEILNMVPDYEKGKELIRQYKINLTLNINPSISREFIVPKEPTSVEDFEQIILDMLKSNETYREIIYDESHDSNYIDNTLIFNISKADITSFDKYPEYRSPFYHVNGYNLSGYDKTVIAIDILSDDFRNATALEMNNEFRNESYNIIEQLIKEGKITASMTEKEKAKVLYKWMAYNLQYDLDLFDEGYTGYGAAINRKASCQGYTSLYNILCKIVGIEVEGIAGLANINTDDPGNHIWTLANLDGEILYIDSTWGDPTPDTKNYCDMTYFAVTKKFLSKTHEFTD